MDVKYQPRTIHPNDIDIPFIVSENRMDLGGSLTGLARDMPFGSQAMGFSHDQLFPTTIPRTLKLAIRRLFRLKYEAEVDHKQSQRIDYNTLSPFLVGDVISKEDMESKDLALYRAFLHGTERMGSGLSLKPAEVVDGKLLPISHMAIQLMRWSSRPLMNTIFTKWLDKDLQAIRQIRFVWRLCQTRGNREWMPTQVFTTEEEAGEDAEIVDRGALVFHIPETKIAPSLSIAQFPSDQLRERKIIDLGELMDLQVESLLVQYLLKLLWNDLIHSHLSVHEMDLALQQILETPLPDCDLILGSNETDGERVCNSGTVRYMFNIGNSATYYTKAEMKQVSYLPMHGIKQIKTHQGTIERDEWIPLLYSQDPMRIRQVDQLSNILLGSFFPLNETEFPRWVGDAVIHDPRFTTVSMHDLFAEKIRQLVPIWDDLKEIKYVLDLSGWTKQRDSELWTRILQKLEMKNPTTYTPPGEWRMTQSIPEIVLTLEGIFASAASQEPGSNKKLKIEHAPINQEQRHELGNKIQSVYTEYFGRYDTGEKLSDVTYMFGIVIMIRLLPKISSSSSSSSSLVLPLSSSIIDGVSSNQSNRRAMKIAFNIMNRAQSWTSIEDYHQSSAEIKKMLSMERVASWLIPLIMDEIKLRMASLIVERKEDKSSKPSLSSSSSSLKLVERKQDEKKSSLDELLTLIPAEYWTVADTRLLSVLSKSVHKSMYQVLETSPLVRFERTFDGLRHTSSKWNEILRIGRHNSGWDGLVAIAFMLTCLLKDEMFQRLVLLSDTQFSYQFEWPDVEHKESLPSMFARPQDTIDYLFKLVVGDLQKNVIPARGRINQHDESPLGVSQICDLFEQLFVNETAPSVSFVCMYRLDDDGASAHVSVSGLWSNLELRKFMYSGRALKVVRDAHGIWEGFGFPTVITRTPLDLHFDLHVVEMVQEDNMQMLRMTYTLREKFIPFRRVYNLSFENIKRELASLVNDGFKTQMLKQGMGQDAIENVFRSLLVFSNTLGFHVTGIDWKEFKFPSQQFVKSHDMKSVDKPKEGEKIVYRAPDWVTYTKQTEIATQWKFCQALQFILSSTTPQVFSTFIEKADKMAKRLRDVGTIIAGPWVENEGDLASSPLVDYRDRVEINTGERKTSTASPFLDVMVQIIKHKHGHQNPRDANIPMVLLGSGLGLKTLDLFMVTVMTPIMYNKGALDWIQAPLNLQLTLYYGRQTDRHWRKIGENPIKEFYDLSWHRGTIVILDTLRGSKYFMNLAGQISRLVAVESPSTN